MDIHILSASAGSGKTTALTAELARALDPEGGLGVRPDRILATTFTRKAAHELQERARRTLLDQGRWEDAQLLSAAWIGTVNGVCGQILQEFAFDLGLSPDLEVIPEDEADALLLAACAEVLEEKPWSSHVREAAGAFGIESWTDDVRAIVQLARNNGIAPEALEESARRSLDGMLALLDPPDARGAATMDADLGAALEQAAARLAPIAGGTKVATEALASMARARTALARSELSWGDRARLAILSGGKAGQPLIAEMQREAAGILGHPGLRTDLERYVRAIFRFAARGLEHYREYKEERRLIDFVDQEERVLALLRIDEARRRIAERVEFMLVDEFQDTSPIQLAIFVELAGLARRVVWVGDPKQSIYGFRGADPALMAACLRNLEGRTSLSVLDVSYRSRPDLVRFASAVFSRGLAPQGMEPRQVKLTPRRDDASQYGEVAPPPALALWLLQSRKVEEDRHALAHGVKRLLDDASRWTIIDRVTGTPRPPTAGDLAILCHSNKGCAETAAALAGVGVAASLARPGLLATQEGMLAEAALRTLLDPRDSLAAAVIACLDGVEGLGREDWLAMRLAEIEAWRSGTEPDEQARRAHPALARLEACRDQARRTSPSEALDLAMEAVDLPRFCLRSERSSQRLDNLEALRGLAARYEGLCASRRGAATPAGLVLYLRRVAESEADAQAHETGGNAVHVITYHASKGLEWPVVILSDLDRGAHPDPFGAEAASDGARLDPMRPLAGRWIRFWLSPFGRLSSGIEYLERARESDVGVAARRKDREQEARLLYVAMTRARDVMILAAREGAGGWKRSWIERLCGTDHQPVIGEPRTLADGVTSWPLPDGVETPVRVERWAPATDPAPAGPQSQTWFARCADLPPAGLPARLPGRHRPLDPRERACLAMGEIVRFDSAPERLSRSPHPEELGHAVHAFLACDTDEHAGFETRVERARRLVAAFGQDAHVRADDLVVASDALRDLVTRRLGPVKWHREVPLACRHGSQEIHGVADLLLERPGGEWLIVDHKSYPGPPSTWPAEAEKHLPQLEAYARAVEGATGGQVRTCWLHFPLAGGLLEIRRTPPEQRPSRADTGIAAPAC